jgi:triacylglycerol esterase/lipase EstA (alpha/beta hydrolase family)
VKSAHRRGCNYSETLSFVPLSLVFRAAAAVAAASSSPPPAAGGPYNFHIISHSHDDAGKYDGMVQLCHGVVGGSDRARKVYPLVFEHGIASGTEGLLLALLSACLPSLLLLMQDGSEHWRVRRCR